MATWHIIPNYCDSSAHRGVVINALTAYRYSELFKAEGFSVDVLPADQIGITVSHNKHSAMSLFILSHHCAYTQH